MKTKTKLNIPIKFHQSFQGHIVSLEFSRPVSKKPNETLWEYLISLLFLFGENPK